MANCNETRTGSTTTFTELFEHTQMTFEIDKLYSTEYGTFTIVKTRFMHKSVSSEGKDLVFGLTPEAVTTGLPCTLRTQARAQEQVVYEGSVGGKL